ncbi:hypothetical protein RQP46_008957 [Phenoliferia psychrophenolica]
MFRAALKSTHLRPRVPVPPRAPQPQLGLRHFVGGSQARSGGSQQSGGGKASRVAFIAVLGFMPVFTAFLGTWQIQRLRWKLQMIDQLESKLDQDAVGLPARIDLEAIPEFAYRRVYVEGTFDHDHEILLGPRTRDGEIGFQVIAPFVRGEGKDTILVNRGFVKRDHKDRRDRPEGEIEGKVQIVGMLRDQDRSNSFTPQNTPAKEEWVFSDIKQMADHTGAEPVLVDEIFAGNAGQIREKLAVGSPVGRAASIELRNQHLTYAVTWYALSLATAFLFIRLVRQPSKAMSSAAQFRGVS